MPIDPKLELPIEWVKVSGPAVDALEARKESDNHERASAVVFIENFERVKGDLLNGLCKFLTKKHN